jgi:hypothetical protein
LNLIQEDRAVFCKHGYFCKHGREARPASSMGWLAMWRRTRSAVYVISITNQIGIHRYQRVGRRAQSLVGLTEPGPETKMTAHLPRLAIVAVALTVLSMGSLGYGLYSKSRHVSGCRAQLVQLQLIEVQLDTTAAALDAAESQLHGAKR